MQDQHTDLGLSLSFASLVAFIETKTAWDKVVNTVGYQGFSLLWQKHHRVSLPLAPGHPSHEAIFLQDLYRQWTRARATAEDVQTHSILTPQRQSQDLDHIPAPHSHITAVKSMKKWITKNPLHKTNPTGFPCNNPLHRVVYLHCLSDLMFWGA